MFQLKKVNEEKKVEPWKKLFIDKGHQHSVKIKDLHQLNARNLIFDTCSPRLFKKETLWWQNDRRDPEKNTILRPQYKINLHFRHTLLELIYFLYPCFCSDIQLHCSDRRLNFSSLSAGILRKIPAKEWVVMPLE